MSLSNEDVVEISKRFVAARWATDLDNDLIMQMEMQEIPALFFFSPTGTYVHRVPPLQRMSPRGVASAMKLALLKAERSKMQEDDLRQKLADNPEDLASRDALAKLMRKGYRFDAARTEELAAFKTADQLGRNDADARLAELLYLDLKMRRFDRAAQAIRAFKQQYPDSQHLERVEYYRGLTEFHGGRRIDKAAKIWEEQLGRFPNGSWAHKARGMLQRARTQQADRKRYADEVPEAWQPRPTVKAPEASNTDD